MPLRLLCLSVLCLCSVVASAETSWIWGAKNDIAKQEVWFRTSFELKEVPAKALLQAAADNHCVVWLNGKALGGSDDWAEAFNAEVGGDLKAGGAQWMKAASGVIHSEMPRQANGLMRGFQLWINLPASEKMSDPAYQEFSATTIPEVTQGGARVRVLAGEFNGTHGVIEDLRAKMAERSDDV